MLVAMAAMVAEDAPQVWQDVQRHLAEDEWNDVASSAHKLKGMLSTFDTGAPIPELQEMIAAARKERVNEVRSCFSACRQDVERLIQEIDDLGSLTAKGSH